jgi:hypothetical protein
MIDHPSTQILSLFWAERHTFARASSVLECGPPSLRQSRRSALHLSALPAPVCIAEEEALPFHGFSLFFQKTILIFIRLS